LAYAIDKRLSPGATVCGTFAAAAEGTVRATAAAMAVARRLRLMAEAFDPARVF
jgi:hypothetical protein